MRGDNGLQIETNPTEMFRSNPDIAIGRGIRRPWPDFFFRKMFDRSPRYDLTFSVEKVAATIVSVRAPIAKSGITPLWCHSRPTGRESSVVFRRDNRHRFPTQRSRMTKKLFSQQSEKHSGMTKRKCFSTNSCLQCTGPVLILLVLVRYLSGSCPVVVRTND